VHFLQYGVLAGVLYLALRVRAARLGSPRRWSAATIAALLTALVGWGDEGIQALVPSRVYDLRDVGFNALAGILAVLTLALREMLRQDRQAISTASE
jgi:VanZ family protein